MTTVLLYGAYAAASYLLVLQCELRLGYSATQAGAVLIPEAAVFLILSPLSGALVSRAGPPPPQRLARVHGCALPIPDREPSPAPDPATS